MVCMTADVVDVVFEDVTAHGRVPLYDGVRRVRERQDGFLLEVVEWRGRRGRGSRRSSAERACAEEDEAELRAALRRVLDDGAAESGSGVGNVER